MKSAFVGIMTKNGSSSHFIGMGVMLTNEPPPLETLMRITTFRKQTSPLAPFDSFSSLSNGMTNMSCSLQWLKAQSRRCRDLSMGQWLPSQRVGAIFTSQSPYGATYKAGASSPTVNTDEIVYWYYYCCPTPHGTRWTNDPLGIPEAPSQWMILFPSAPCSRSQHN